MSAEHTQPLEGRVIQAGDRFTKSAPAEPPQEAIRLGREHGAEVEKVAEKAPRPTVGERAADAGMTTLLGVAHSVQTVWGYQTAGEIAEQIRGVKAEMRASSDRAERAELAKELEALRDHRRQVVHARHREPATIAGAIGAVAYPAGIVIGTLAAGPLALAGALPIPVALYVAGRRARKQRELVLEQAAPSDAVELARADVVELVETAPGVYSPANLPEGKPFPIAQAQTETEAAECMLRALLAETVPVGDVSEVQRTPWGWQCIVRVTSGTPEKIINAAANLETTFDLPQNGVRVQPLVERRARAKFRLVEGDPFAAAPPPPYRAPKSLSITDRARIGSSIDGDPLEITLAGVMGESIAASGGGKTGILQAMAEVTTACRDVITIDLDPAGDGLEDLGGAARLQGRTHEQIEHVLLFLLMLAKARARLRKKLGMGRKWQASPEHPAIVTFIDEYPALSKLGKDLAFALMKVGRKEQLVVILAAQGGSTTYLGENIASMLALKIVGPCKFEDVKAVFGPGAVADGYLPHRLKPATDTDPRDAGHVFAQGIPGTADAPVEYKIHEHPKGMLAQLAEERRDAGLLDPDAESLAAMEQVDLPDYVEPEYDNEGNLKKPAPVELLTWEQLLRLCEADPPSAGVTPVSPERRAVRATLDVMAQLGLDRFRVETMAEHLRTRFPDLFPELAADDLGRLLRDAGCGGTVSIGAVDGRRNASGYRIEALERAL
ncbi:hypothetical protein ACTWP5_27690 [Streptomyces sp. 4N509B]|uniref:hypothetical protein n=1 Tax=Streptomyces sp. 4N509B TaxID=3457413 RepID=UPI003FD54BCA